METSLFIQIKSDTSSNFKFLLSFVFYRPQRSWGKVIYSVACVKNSVHSGDGGSTWAGTPPRQVHPPGAVHAGRYGQQAGGTHPTGMHSC